MTEFLSKLTEWLNSLYGLPGIVVVFLSCIAFGYVLRFIKAFPNNGIPLACWLFGGIMLPLISERGPSNLRIWMVKNLLVGLLIGFLAWLVHNLVIKKFEDWLSAQFPAIGKFLGNDADPTPPPDKP